MTRSFATTKKPSSRRRTTGWNSFFLFLAHHWSIFQGYKYYKCNNDREFKLRDRIFSTRVSLSLGLEILGFLVFLSFYFVFGADFEDPAAKGSPATLKQSFRGIPLFICFVFLNSSLFPKLSALCLFQMWFCWVLWLQ